LILQDDMDVEKKVYEDAFDFAALVLNNNLMDMRLSPDRDRTKLYPLVKNKTRLTDNYKLGGAICSMVTRQVQVILGTSHTTGFNTIQSYSQALQIPYVLATPPRPPGPDGYHYDVSVCPPYIEAVMKVVAGHSAWSEKLFYVYDSDDGLWRLQRMYHYFQTKGITVRALDAFRIRDKTRAYSVLRDLDVKEHAGFNKTIVLDMSSVSAYRLVLEQIVDVGMNRQNYHYILAGPHALDLDLYRDFFSQFLFGGVEITGFRIVDNNTNTYKKWEQVWRQHQTDFPNLFPLRTGSALMIDAVRVVYEALKADIPAIRSIRTGLRHDQKTCDMENPRPSELGPVIIKAINEVRFLGLSGPIALTAGRRSQFRVDVHKLTFKERMRKIDTWTSAELAKSRYEQLRPEESVRNKTQMVTTVIEPPFVMRIENMNGAPPVGSSRDLEGYCIDLLDALARNEDFDYDITVATAYGKKNQTSGTWDGLIGQLTREEKDIAVAPLTITKDRERVVDFSKPFMDTGISIMIKKPDKTKPGVFSFMDPLDKYVWLCIAMGFLAVSFVLYFVGRFSPYEWNVVEDSTEKTATTIFSISNTLWFSLGALMQQGSDISPRSFSGRVIGSAWWFFTLIIISSYTANLAAFLTIEKLVVSIDSADDLINNPRISYGTKRSGSSWDFFAKSTVTTFVTMKNEMLDRADDVLVDEYYEGVKKVRQMKGSYAFLLESAMNLYYGQQEPCDTMMVGDKLDNKGYGVATYLNHPLRHNINIAVLTLKEKGELIKLKQKWWYDKGQCGDVSHGKESTGNQSALTLSNVSGIFHILIGGLVLSMVTASLEYLVQRKLRNRKKLLEQKNKSYTMPDPPPPPRRKCFSSDLDRPAGKGPAWENGYTNEPSSAMEQQNLMSAEPDDLKVE
ncbi:glutamate receptor, partial [Plakobranchus ocellatus]